MTTEYPFFVKKKIFDFSSNVKKKIFFYTLLVKNILALEIQNSLRRNLLQKKTTRLGNCNKPLFIFSRQKNSGKRKRDLLPDNPMIKKNFGESRVSDLDKALEIDLNL